MVSLPDRRSPTIEAIETYYEGKQEAEFYPSIRGSQIGHPCERRLWYLFRWVNQPERFEGRILRLFKTGHREEDRLVDDLQNAGISVQSRDPDTRQQWEVVAVDGHFKGHLDGIAKDIPEAPSTEHLLEVKTHNERSFQQLIKHGVEVAKPEHVAQMQAYMQLRGLSRALYLAKNKNTDALYVERIKYDAVHGAALIAKAERIKAATRVPERISDDPSFFQCRYCHLNEACHHAQWSLRNCRTCLHSEPINNGNWFCHRHKIALLKDQQERGCPNHLYLPSLVPGEQVDVDQAAETVTYRMADGSQWVDGANGDGAAG